jgi:hypothetical protein
LYSSGAGGGLALEQGGLVVTNNTNNEIFLARATHGAMSGKSFFEAAFYGEGILVDRATVGIVAPSHLLDKYVGQQDGYGLKAGSGGIYRNNLEVISAANAPAVGKKVFIGVLYDATAGTCTWYVNGSFHARVTGVPVGPWYPAVSVSGVKANDLRCYVNFGQYAFAFPQDGTDNAVDPPVEGWYSEGANSDPLYLCPRNSPGFTSRPDDTPVLVTFEPRIANADAMSVSTRSSVWPWGNGNSGSSYGELEVDNADGRYDNLAGTDLRDQVARIVTATPGGSFDAANAVFTAVVDDVKCIGESRLRISFKDIQSTLERPLQRRIFPPWADPGVAFRPLPITLGACRNVAPMLEDQVERRYRLHDAPITNITAVRDKGTLLDKNSSPPQYVPTDDLQGFLLQTNPVGLLTADVSSEGAQVAIPGVTDVLDGAGSFANWPVGATAPTGWIYSGGSTNELTRTNIVQGANVAALSTRINFGNGDSAFLRYGTAILEGGKTYRIQFKLVRTYGAPPSVSPGLGYGLMVMSATSATKPDGNPSAAISPYRQPLVAPQFGSQGIAYTFTYTVPPGPMRYLYFVVTTADAYGTSLGTGVGSGAYFYDIKVQRLGEIEQALPLQGITLERYWSEIFRRAGVPQSAWSREDCAAIDLAAKYKFGVHIRDPITVLQALRLPLDTFGAAMFTDAQGRFRVRRLTDPTPQLPSTPPGPSIELAASFGAGDIQRGLTPRNDLAPGLTTSIGARRNWQPFNDSDFVTDLVLVPAATRTQFKAKYQFVRNAPAALASAYGFASSAPELESLLDDPADAQKEILRMTAPYTIDANSGTPLGKLATTLPRFIEFTVYYDTVAPPALLFGDVINVTYPRHRLAGGQPLVVVGTTINPYTKTMQIVAWGSV